MHPRALLVLSVLSAVLGPVPASSAGTDSGLPVPRFVTLRAVEANMRTGPGEQYPIKWTYQRPGLPLEVVREYYHWRRVRDWQGTEGWMHSAMLSAKRAVMVVGGTRTLHQDPDPNSPAVARVEATSVGRLLECPEASDWCRIEVVDVKGWMLRDEIWGVFASETVE